MKANKLISTKTQLPYEFYYLDYCKPTEIVNSAENPGEVLCGDRIENSPYAVSIFMGKILFYFPFNLALVCLVIFLYNSKSISACVSVSNERKQAVQLLFALRNWTQSLQRSSKIDDEYHVNM